ncbi:MAG: response regulator transcription factor [Bacteroidota bacterium]|nr:response regulator transcription factor [Bacteroidota bacterium]
MIRTVVIFGICMALLIGMLKWAEYLFFARDLALEAYVGIVALFCTALGGWIGWKLTHKQKETSIDPIPKTVGQSIEFIPGENTFNLSPREHEVLVMISEGHSYQEIADRMNVSLSTVKTHASNLFSKMDVQRRTQAVMLAQKSGIIPTPKA